MRPIVVPREGGLEVITSAESPLFDRLMELQASGGVERVRDSAYRVMSLVYWESGLKIYATFDLIEIGEEAPCQKSFK